MTSGMSIRPIAGAGAETENPNSSMDSDPWAELLRAVAARNRPTQALLLNAAAHRFHNRTLSLSIPSYLIKRFNQRRVDVVRNALQATLGGEWEVKLQPATGQSTAP